ncbi:RNA polymerase sigma factor [Gorillibacterium sp. sgz5001074]|uniref:RNA polymerase sigma factor n=1 Tax=Gorillibacterium sp. sgz5001074 TaxID=3446695 RepID=UPI003F675CB3
MKAMTDAELMKQVMEKHRPALEELYDRYVKLVYSFALKATRNEQMSRDIVQLVFTRLWTTKSGYDPAKGQFVSWLLTIVRNLTVDCIRRERRHAVPETADIGAWEELAASPDQEPEQVLSRTLVREELREAYSRLSDSQIRLIEQVYWQGYTLSEAAQSSGEPLGTVKSRLHQSLKLLRKYLQEPKGGMTHAKPTDESM